MNQIHTMAARGAMAAVLLLVCATGPGCGSGPARTSDPLMDLRNPELSVRDRAQAVTRAWEAAPAGSEQREPTRRALKDLVWADNAPADVRVRAVELLLDDPDPQGAADAREMARLRLATEPSRLVVVAISKRAAERGWTEFIPSLVRAYAKPVRDLEENDRAERAALTTLAPGKAVEEIAFEVFLNPPENEGPYGQRWDRKARADAWDVLARIDPEGTWRRRAIAEGRGAGAAVLDQLRTGLRDLRCIPRTGDELNWLASLLDEKKPENRRWWGEATAAIASVDAVKVPTLELRHAEAIRWARSAAPELLGKSREELLSELRGRIDPRRTYRRLAESTDFQRPVREDLGHWAERLTWPDLITILAVDRLVREPGVVMALTQQVAIDRRDTTTEYGGLLELVGTQPRATLFPPRASTRLGDTRFVASEDMLSRADRALAHYHFHVQADRNERGAGPSGEDLEYARRHGRTCFVLTSVRSGYGDIDYYQPDGIVLDLGEVQLVVPR